jgi:pimeloyl-ACP methyl ester carboxylesterase
VLSGTPFLHTLYRYLQEHFQIFKFPDFQIIHLISYSYKTKHITLPGNCDIAYIDEGKGPQTLLFIHGLANYAMIWKKNIEYLKQHYRCIAIDLPGNGLSAQNDYQFSMQFLAESVHGFIKALGLKNLCIVGHSMGGQVALTTLINHPDSAYKLVLCAPAGFEEFSAFDKTLYYSTVHLYDFVSSEEHMLRSTIENSFYHHHHQGEPLVKELVEIMKTYKMNYYRKMIEGCVKGMLEEPVIDKLNQLKQATLVIFGKQDALIPNKLLHHGTTERIAREGTKKMPYASLELIDDCGHFVQWEKADEVSRLIIAFVGHETK